MRDDQRLARACRTLLATVGLERLWTENGPTPEAAELLARDCHLSSEERIVLLVAWTFWNGAGGPRLAQVLGRFDADPMESLCLLVTASRRDDNSSPTQRSHTMLLEPAKDSVDVLIFVHDIRKSLDFYQGVLGLDKTQELETPVGTSHRLRYGTSIVKLMDPKHLPPAG